MSISPPIDTDDLNALPDNTELIETLNDKTRSRPFSPDFSAPTTPDDSSPHSLFSKTRKSRCTHANAHRTGNRSSKSELAKHSQKHQPSSETPGIRQSLSKLQTSTLSNTSNNAPNTTATGSQALNPTSHSTNTNKNHSTPRLQASPTATTPKPPTQSKHRTSTL